MDRPVARKLDTNTDFLANPAAQKLCSTLEVAKFKAYFVGGCVRNAVMGVPISDIDIATDAPPDRVMGICKAAGFRPVPTGIDHGTITVVVDGQPFEVTTFRKDVETDGRRAVVAFSTDLREDARRRDFTMNALYADMRGHIIDPVDGFDDARNRRVRFIDDAGQRIREDYLRTLRYFRFSAQYADPSLDWDADALAGISANTLGLETLSAERVGSEMLKLLATPDPTPALAVMQQTGVLATVLPGSDVFLVGPFVHIGETVNAPIDPIARLAALGGVDVEDRLRLSRRDQKHLESIRTLSLSTNSPRALGHVGGTEAGKAAVVLRAAYANTPLDQSAMVQVSEGAFTNFPVGATDLPHLTGAALGAELKRLKQLWLESDLTKSKQDLLTS